MRIPAALNGIVGLKTAEGRIHKGGVFPLSVTLDTVGPLARTVEDCVLLDAAMQGHICPDLRRVEVSAFSLVVPENLVFDDADDAVVANFEAAVERLARHGVRVTRRRIPMLDEVMRVTSEHGTLTSAEAYHLHRDLVEGPDAGRIDPRVVARISGGKRMSAYSLLVIHETQARLRPAMAAELDGALLAMPTVPHTAPEIAPLEADAELFHKANLKTLRNTMLGNVLDLCGVSLPSGRDGKGLPTGILFSAPGPTQNRLMAAALAIEAVLVED